MTDQPGVRVKICGITSSADAAQAVAAGADYLGFTLFPPSPRSVAVGEAAAIIAGLPPGVAKVALTVDADDDLIRAAVDAGVDWLQLHGAETPERVAEVKAATGLPVMKAVGVRIAEDVARVDLYVPVADQILIDAKAPKGAVAPGGNGVAFDWRLIAHREWAVPWMLAGGLTPDNVAEAVRLTGAVQVDVASGTEAAPGIKDPEKVSRFVSAAKA